MRQKDRRRGTVLGLNDYNTRAKDFYDIYLLNHTLSDKLDMDILKEAFSNTIKRRRKENLLPDIQDTITQTLSSQYIHMHWKKYRAEYVYAMDIEFSQVELALIQLFEWAGHKIEYLRKAQIDLNDFKDYNGEIFQTELNDLGESVGNENIVV